MAFAHHAAGYLHIPYWSGKAQNGAGGRLSILMLPMQLAVEWGNVQPALQSKEMVAAAELVTAALDKKEQEAGSGVIDLESWESQEAWTPHDDQADTVDVGGKSDGKGDRSKGGNHGGGRNGLEPKCIGLLVNV